MYLFMKHRNLLIVAGSVVIATAHSALSQQIAQYFVCVLCYFTIFCSDMLSQGVTFKFDLSKTVILNVRKEK